MICIIRKNKSDSMQCVLQGAKGPHWGFAGCGIRPTLSAGFGIGFKISWDTRLEKSKRHTGMRDWTKKICGMSEIT